VEGNFHHLKWGFHHPRLPIWRDANNETFLKNVDGGRWGFRPRPKILKSQKFQCVRMSGVLAWLDDEYSLITETDGLPTILYDPVFRSHCLKVNCRLCNKYLRTARYGQRLSQF